MGELFGSERAFRLARAVVKPTSTRLGLHVRPYTKNVQGLDPWRDVNALLGGVTAPTILDVGANEGQSTARFARLWRGAAIHSFEPSPATFQVLQRNAASLAPTVVHTVNAGVGSEPGRSVLLENSQTDMSSFLAPAEESWGRTIAQTPVDIVTLDQYCESQGIARVDLLKSDTQGFDLEVLKGADRLLTRGAIRLVFLEVTFAHLYEHVPAFDVIYRFLCDRGYHFVGIYELHHAADGRLAWCDALFMHPGGG